VKDVQAGSTRTVAWVNSGVSPIGLSVSILDGTDTLVSSSSMVSSGNGHYFQPITFPSSRGFWVVEWNATINSKPYRNRMSVRTVLGEVD